MPDQFDEFFSKGVDKIRECGIDPYPSRHHFRMVHAREQLAAGLRYYLGNQVKWIPAYDEVAAWLADNKQKGLLCIGTCGLGKTLICQSIIPVLLLQNFNKVTHLCHANEMADDIKSLCKHSLLMVDDIGTEPAGVKFNNKDTPFLRLCDAAEKKGNLLILTANLRTTHGKDSKGNVIPSIEDRYGDLVLSRLRGIVKVIEFKGADMRSVSMAKSL